MGCPSNWKRILTWVGPSHVSSEAGFKFVESAFEFPLLLGFFARLEESRACGGGFHRAGRVLHAGSRRPSEIIRLAPQARAGQEIVFEAGADHLLQVLVS